MKIEREQIVKALEDGLKSSPFVFASWLEGSDAIGTTDQYSDLDVWLDVADGREDETIGNVRNFIRNRAA